MDKQKKQPKHTQITNSKPHDSGSKIIFGNAELCSQFLRNYMDMPILKNVKAEDIEDVSERYLPMFTEERNSDTVKRVKISEKDTLFFISLIEHKTKVDYNISMQLLRYMVYIWEDYEKEAEKNHKGITKTKDFKYPPIVPIVYYEGTQRWSAARNFKDRIFFDRAFEPFTPKFFYKLVQLNEYSVRELVEKNDELSLVMLINRIQSAEEFRGLDLPKNYLKNLSEHSTDELLDIIQKVVETMLRHLKISEEEVEEFTGQVKERKMGELFEHFKDIDLPAARKKARDAGWQEGRNAGWQEGRDAGWQEGRDAGYKDGIQQGMQQGIQQGENFFLIKQVCKKLAKNKNASQIAAELEVEEPVIEQICLAAKKFAPEYNPEQIQRAINNTDI
ncbi:MAG: Rpn family recombination-promoting nuclease/putative transposase [Bacillus sp. (in: Bacteria)]|nr:Rpn family recombination-promoting nuclease/putative transposase [Bacillus sp. (in: firmicutes)]MCM1425396.1 Rpn family recombination-promoting nuclease/putative transposase [Eubacterium sp.]